VTGHDTGPAGGLVVHVGQESDRDRGCVELAL